MTNIEKNRNQSMCLALCMGFIFILPALQGCTTVLWPEYGETYQGALQSATKALQANQEALQKNLIDRQMLRLAGEQSCEYQPAGNFWLLDGEDLKTIIDSKTKNVEACTVFEKSYLAKGEHICGVRHDEQEATKQCLDLLNRNEDLDDKERIAVESHKLGTKRSTPSAQLEVMNLVAAYLDTLTKILAVQQNGAKPDAKGGDAAKSLKEQVAGLQERTESVRTQLKGVGVRNGNDSAFTKAYGGLGVLATLFDDINKIQENEITAMRLREAVIGSKADIDAALIVLRDFASNDLIYGQAIGRSNLFTKNEAIQPLWTKGSPTERYKILEGKMIDSSTTTFNTQVRSLMNKAIEARKALVEVITNPTSEQRRAAAKIAFDNFKTIASDISGVVQLF